jgi:hypothetical protein
MCAFTLASQTSASLESQDMKAQLIVPFFTRRRWLAEELDA